MKVGRNDPCPCRSGKKHKKCCLGRDRPKASPRAAQERIFEQMPPGPLPGDVPAPIMFKGSPIAVMGKDLVYTDQGRTTDELIIAIVAKTLGQEWLKGEIEKEVSARHPIAQWFEDWKHLRSTPDLGRPVGSVILSAPMDGGTRRLMSIGADLWHLQHHESIPPRLLKRLRDHREFQGALYEIAVASIVARAGYKIRWVNESKATRSQPEFFARMERTNESIAVEAKSRRRAGALGFPGDRSERIPAITDVRDLFESALLKDPGETPYLIFVDMNSPEQIFSASEDRAKEMADHLASMAEEMAGKTTLAGSGFAAIVLTNFASHYGAPLIRAPRAWCIIRPMPTAPHPISSNAMTLLSESVFRYGEIPRPRNGSRADQPLRRIHPSDPLFDSGRIDPRGFMHGRSCPYCMMRRTIGNFVLVSENWFSCFSQCTTCRTTWNLNAAVAEKAWMDPEEWEQLATASM